MLVYHSQITTTTIPSSHRRRIPLAHNYIRPGYHFRSNLHHHIFRWGTHMGTGLLTQPVDAGQEKIVVLFRDKITTTLTVI